MKKKTYGHWMKLCSIVLACTMIVTAVFASGLFTNSANAELTEACTDYVASIYASEEGTQAEPQESPQAPQLLSDEPSPTGGHPLPTPYDPNQPPTAPPTLNINATPGPGYPEVFVDTNRATNGVGTEADPFNTFVAGINAVRNGGIMNIMPGRHGEERVRRWGANNCNMA